MDRHGEEIVEDQHTCHRPDHAVLISRRKGACQDRADQQYHQDVFFHDSGTVQVKTDKSCRQYDRRRPSQI